jgi:hypothetical protein
MHAIQEKLSETMDLPEEATCSNAPSLAEEAPFEVAGVDAKVKSDISEIFSMHAAFDKLREREDLLAETICSNTQRLVEEYSLAMSGTEVKLEGANELSSERRRNKQKKKKKDVLEGHVKIEAQESSFSGEGVCSTPHNSVEERLEHASVACSVSEIPASALPQEPIIESESQGEECAMGVVSKEGENVVPLMEASVSSGGGWSTMVGKSLGTKSSKCKSSCAAGDGSENLCASYDAVTEGRSLLSCADQHSEENTHEQRIAEEMLIQRITAQWKEERESLRNECERLRQELAAAQAASGKTTQDVEEIVDEGLDGMAGGQNDPTHAFVKKWHLNHICLRRLRELSPETQTKVMADFDPQGSRNQNFDAKFLAFVKSRRAHQDSQTHQEDCTSLSRLPNIHDGMPTSHRIPPQREVVSVDTETQTELCGVASDDQYERREGDYKIDEATPTLMPMIIKPLAPRASCLLSTSSEPVRISIGNLNAEILYAFSSQLFFDVCPERLGTTISESDSKTHSDIVDSVFSSQLLCGDYPEPPGTLISGFDTKPHCDSDDSVFSSHLFFGAYPETPDTTIFGSDTKTHCDSDDSVFSSHLLFGVFPETLDTRISAFDSKTYFDSNGPVFSSQLFFDAFPEKSDATILGPDTKTNYDSDGISDSSTTCCLPDCACCA